MSKALQKPAIQVDFKPSEKMELWLDTSIELATQNKSAISDKCGVDRSNWYDWIKKPGFEDWYYENYKRLRRRWLPVLDEAGLRFAIKSEKGYQHWEAMNRKLGELGDEKPLTQTQTNVQINLGVPDGND